MNLYIFGSLLFALQFCYWIIGRKYSIKSETKEDYFLASKTVKLFPLMMTFLATQVGGGLVLGAAEEAYKYGFITLLLPLGAAVGLMILGMGIGKKMASYKVTTVAEILEISFKSKLLRKIASIFSIVSLFMILVAQVIASSKFLVSLGFNSSIVFILFWAIVIIYTVQGGLRSIISTDMAQAFVFTLIFLFCFIKIFPLAPMEIFLPKLESFALAYNKVWGWFFMPLFFMLIEQDMGQRCFAGKNGKIVSRATLLSGVLTFLICTVPIFIGVLGQKLGIIAPKGASILMIIIEKITNPWIAALVGCAVLAAIISTASSLINAISSNLMSDYFSKSSIKITRIVTAAISLFAIFFAFYLDNIVDLLIQSYELSISSLFVATLFAFYKKNGNYISAFLSIIFGFLGFFIFRIFPSVFPKELLSIILSFLGYYIGEMRVKLLKVENF